MESKYELKEIDIKNYYFDDIIEVDEYINANRILLDEKSYENNLVYKILHKTFI